MVEVNVKVFYPETIPEEILKAIKEFLNKNIDTLIEKIAETIVIKEMKDNNTFRDIENVAATLVTGLGVSICNTYYGHGFAEGFSPSEYKPVFFFVETEGYDIVISLKNTIGQTVNICGYLFENNLYRITKDKADDYLAIYTLLKAKVQKMLGESK